MGAIGEWIAVAAIGGIGDLIAACLAAGGIGNDGGAHLAAAARHDMEAAIGRGIRQRRPFYGVDAPKRGRIFLQPLEEPVEIGGHAPGPDHHPLGIVPHLAGEAMIMRQAIDQRPKANPLHQSANADRPRFHPRLRR